MKYQVFDCEKPADCFHTDGIDESWNNSIFDSIDEAKYYLKNWLGEWEQCVNVDKMKANQQVDYDGYGDIVEIKVIDDDM